MILPLRADSLGWEVWQGPDPFPHLLDQHRGTPDDHDDDDDDDHDDDDDDDDQHRWTPGHFYDNDDHDDDYDDEGHQITIMMMMKIMVIIISFCWCFSAGSLLNFCAFFNDLPCIIK